MTADGSEILRSPVERTVVEIPLFTTGEEHACQVVKLGFLNHQQYHLSKGLEGHLLQKQRYRGMFPSSYQI